MFANKKQKDEDKNFELDEISMKMETMKSDLEQKPASEEMIKIKKSKDNKDLEKKLPGANKEEIKSKLSFKNPEPKINRPKTKLSSRYLPKAEDKITSSSPFLKKESLPKNEKSEPNISAGDHGLDKFMKKEEKTNILPNREMPKINKFDSFDLNKPTLEKKSASIENSSSFMENLTKEKGVSVEKKLNWKLLSVTIIVFIIALGSGAYYYYFMLKEGGGNLINNPSIEEEVNINENNNTAVIEENVEETINENLPESLRALSLLEIDNGSLVETLNNLIENKNELSNGIIYQVEKNEEILTATQLLNEFSASFPSIELDLGNGWIFIKENQNQKKDVGLILAINNNSSAIFESIKNSENNLIGNLENIYINRSLPNLPALPIFSTSEINKNFRYYNFTPNNTSLSLDWGIITLQNNFPVLIFSTSLDATQFLLNKLGVNQ